MIDGWFSVLIISLIVSLGGLAVLLVQSYRGEPLQHTEERHPLPKHRDHHRRARITSVLDKDRMSHIPTSAAIADTSAAWREFRESVNRPCGMVPNPGECLRIRALNDDALCGPGKIYKQDFLIDGIRAAQERRTR